MGETPPGLCELNDAKGKRRGADGGGSKKKKKKKDAEESEEQKEAGKASQTQSNSYGVHGDLRRESEVPAPTSLETFWWRAAAPAEPQHSPAVPPAGTRRSS